MKKVSVCISVVCFTIGVDAGLSKKSGMIPLIAFDLILGISFNKLHMRNRFQVKVSFDKTSM